jgi:hypothetical protein
MRPVGSVCPMNLKSPLRIVVSGDSLDMMWSTPDLTIGKVYETLIKI